MTYVFLHYAITGHRPDKLGGYSPAAQDRLYRFALDVLKEAKPAVLMSGMALGWDQATARAATFLNIRWIAAVPFAGQESQWPAESQREYHRLLGYAQQVVVVSPGGYAISKMQTRNEYMVNWASQHLGRVLALWNGTAGGTANAVRYALVNSVPVGNAWPWWQGRKTTLEPITPPGSSSHV